jgi:hypothetical protein
VLRAGTAALAVSPEPRQPLVQRWKLTDTLDRIEALLAAYPAGGTMAGFLPLLARDDSHLPFKAECRSQARFWRDFS